MELADRIHETLTPEEKARDMRTGANWFFWIAALSVINTFVVTFGGTFNFAVGLGVTRYVDGMLPGQAGPGGYPELPLAALGLNILIAAAFAGFGYFARRGSDVAFVIGMFLYVADAMVVLGFKDFFGFAFHLLALFFLFKGLLASRKRYDPSV